MSAHAVKPDLPTPFPAEPGVWHCPKTGLAVPKDPAKNLAWRANLLREAADDRGLQQALYTACGQSLLFWVNAFAFTYRVQETDQAGRRRQAENAHVPFVTWEIQDRHFTAIEDAIDNGYDLLTDKTRDMGASWAHIAVLHHQWLFKPGRLFLEMSRVETDVDGADNPRCLFVKHDYINKWLPKWMLPRIDRTRMHLVNLDNGSRIDGESSNKAAGSGDRRHAILMDEFAKMENAEKIKAATADVSACRLVNSTPWGAGTAYSKWRLSGQIKVFVLPWYEHPEKGAGRYVVQEEQTGKWRIRSPWYDREALVRTPKEMAQEIDMDHIGSGDTFFEAATVEQHKRLFARAPVATRTIDFLSSVALEEIPDIVRRKQLSMVRVGPGSTLQIWGRLVNGRLDQKRNYVVACDISQGQGASNSVATVLCKETGEKVAMWADANYPPHEFARVVVALCLWVGGASHGSLPLLGWEANGPGWTFGREVVTRFMYPRYYHDKRIGAATEKQTIRYGWHSSQDKKEALLGNYSRALTHGGFINHCEASLDEALMYVRYESGAIGPAALMNESENARKTHGDRVIADALALWILDDTPAARHAEPEAPGRSFAHLKREWDRRKKARDAGKSFDFTRG